MSRLGFERNEYVQPFDWEKFWDRVLGVGVWLGVIGIIWHYDWYEGEALVWSSGVIVFIAIIGVCFFDD